MPDRNIGAEAWSFTRSPEGWQWHRAGSTLVESRRSSRAFATLLDCINDAAEHGYNRRVGSRADESHRTGS